MVAPGTVLGGRFEIVEELGRGGHGVVYRGRQRPLARDVAVKVLRAEASTPEMMSRFAREVGLVQRLEHPNTVRLYDFGTTDEGTPFIVFELLRGRGLDAELAARPLPASRIAKIAVQVLKALSEAHALGIIHRDIKPANVLLVDYAGERDFVKLLDFGVARSMLPSSRESVITHDGQLIGTPAYMAPEQVRDEPLGAGTDLYALGLVMAEAMTGRPVFEGSDVAICLAHASPSPVPLAAEVRASALGAIVARATEKDPAKRYASADEMIAAIERTGLAADRGGAPETRRLDPSGEAATDPLAGPLERAPHTERLPAVARSQTVQLAPSGHATTAPPPPLRSPESLAGASASGPPPSAPITARRGVSAAPPPYRPRTPGTWETLGVVALFALAGLGLWHVVVARLMGRPGDEATRPTLAFAEEGPLAREFGLERRLAKVQCRIAGRTSRTVEATRVESYTLRGCDRGPVTLADAPEVSPHMGPGKQLSRGVRLHGRIIVAADDTDKARAEELVVALTKE